MDTKNYTVLVIEDEELLLKAIDRKLKLKGLSPILATSGNSAFEILKKSKQLPDVIWLDYYLNDMNGIDFMNTLRRNDKWSRIPTIIVSNSTSDEKVKNMLSFGVKKYFLKAEHRLDEIIDYIKEFVSKGGDRDV